LAEKKYTSLYITLIAFIPPGSLSRAFKFHSMNKQLVRDIKSGHRGL